MKQIDYRQYWHQDSPRKIRWDIRPGVNGEHDFIFLRSLIRDSSLKLSDVKYRNEQLSIKIARECYEISKPLEGIFYITESRLIFSPVISVQWQMNHIVVDDIDPLEELGICSIYYSTSRYETDDEPYDIFLGNPGGWLLKITMSRKKQSRVCLTDLIVPYINPNIEIEFKEDCTITRPRKTKVTKRK